jgi:hypothetical protein
MVTVGKMTLPPMAIEGPSTIAVGGRGSDAVRAAEGIRMSTLAQMREGTREYRYVDADGRVLGEGLVAHVRRCRDGNVLRVTFAAGGVHEVRGAPGIRFRGCAGEGGSCLWA